MSRFTAWIAALLILIGSVWSQGQIIQDIERDARFGFGLLESWRRNFCNTFCSSTDSTNVLSLPCALKCPDFNPSPQTTVSSVSPSTASSSSPSTSPSSSSTPSSSSVATQQSTTQTSVASTTQSAATSSTPTSTPMTSTT